MAERQQGNTEEHEERAPAQRLELQRAQAGEAARIQHVQRSHGERGEGAQEDDQPAELPLGEGWIGEHAAIIAL